MAVVCFGLQMGACDLVAWWCFSVRLPGSTLEVALAGFDFALCSVCAFSAALPDCSWMRRLTLHAVCAKISSAPFSFEFLLVQPVAYACVLFPCVLAVYVLCDSCFCRGECMAHVWLSIVWLIASVVADHPQYRSTSEASIFLWVKAVAEAIVCIGLSMRILCSRSSGATTAVEPVQTEGDMPRASSCPGRCSSQSPDVIGNTPSLCSEMSTDEDLCSFNSVVTNHPDAALHHEIRLQFAGATFFNFVARALNSSAGNCGNACQGTAGLQAGLVQEMGTCCKTTANLWLAFLEGVWQLDECCAGCAPSWLLTLHFRDGVLTYSSRLQGELAQRDGAWHLEGAPLLFISQTLIARFSHAGDHLVWRRQLMVRSSS
eukprot:TRINITY_DN36457_c0_g1_i2.p1 TRINITY_DN36457_c0_g1~~TRINITY_DN36457_c0_g1_i2.p1  ORF type:complete len:374 (+),score=23.15 TRINITY_DN36457_c0_g1_i2:133-1254(+)